LASGSTTAHNNTPQLAAVAAVVVIGSAQEIRHRLTAVASGVTMVVEIVVRTMASVLRKEGRKEGSLGKEV
jgi:hypothetical protein